MVKQRSTAVPVAPPTTNSGPDVVAHKAPEDSRPKVPLLPERRQTADVTSPSKTGIERPDVTPGSSAMDDAIVSAQETITSKINDLSEATSVRRLSFANEEPTREEHDAAPPEKPGRRRVHFERTAGARIFATR